MAQIPSWFMVVTGLVVAGVSYYVGDKFRLFFYIGLFFFVFGVVKTFILRNKYRPEYISRQAEIKKNTFQAQQDQYKKYVYCSHCGSVLHSTDNFCYKCGARLR